jgi:hypothetical protein
MKICWSPTYLIHWGKNTLTLRVDDNSIPTIDLKLSSTTVSCGSAKLRTSWEPELTADLHAYYSMDVASEFRAIDYKVKRTAEKRRRYKDRKIYIKLLEEWSGKNARIKY